MTLTEGRAAGPREDLYEPRPAHPDYAILPVEHGFTWEEALRDHPSDRFYLVVFRSVRSASADSEVLKRYDDAAYAAALESGGLLYYFKGELNERRECLSFCLWESREQALRATAHASHSKAADISAEMYDSYRLERYEVRKVGGPGEERLDFQRLEEGYGRDPASV